MPKMEMDGLEEFGFAMNEILAKSEFILKRSVYDGAHVVFEEVKHKVQMLPVNDQNSSHRDITSAQKAGLISGLYGSRLQSEGGVYVYIGFTGYNDVKTKKHPKGQPNILVARSIESGGSHMNKHPFMKQAANTAKPRAVEAVRKTFEAEMAKISE